MGAAPGRATSAPSSATASGPSTSTPMARPNTGRDRRRHRPRRAGDQQRAQLERASHRPRGGLRLQQPHAPFSRPGAGSVRLVPQRGQPLSAQHRSGQPVTSVRCRTSSSKARPRRAARRRAEPRGRPRTEIGVGLRYWHLGPPRARARAEHPGVCRAAAGRAATPSAPGATFSLRTSAAFSPLTPSPARSSSRPAGGAARA